MLKFRESAFMKAICFYMAVSIFAISCDPNGNILVNKSIDDQTEGFLEQYSGLMSEQECADFKQSIDKIKAYVWQQRSSGINPSRADIANFVYDMSVEDSIITSPSETEKQAFAEFVQNNTWNGDQTGIINKLQEEQYFGSDMANVLHEFKANFSNVSSYSEAYTAIDSMRNAASLSSLNTQEQSAFQEALDGAERTVCYQEMSENEVQTRGWCEECNWQLHWVELVISIVVTIVAWIFAIVTLGLSTLFTSVILFTVWTTTWVLVCIWVWCDDQVQPCPDGQSPVCEGSFTFDESIPACTNSSFPANAFQFGNCMMSPMPSSGGCPSGSSPLGINCLWECLTVTPVQNSEGAWQIPFTCQ